MAGPSSSKKFDLPEDDELLSPFKNLALHETDLALHQMGITENSNRDTQITHGLISISRNAANEVTGVQEQGIGSMGLVRNLAGETERERLISDELISLSFSLTGDNVLSDHLPTQGVNRFENSGGSLVRDYSNSGTVFAHRGSSDWSNDGNMSTSHYNFDFNQVPPLKTTTPREGPYSDSGTNADPNRADGYSNSGIVFAHGGSSDWSNDGNTSTSHYNFDFYQAPLLNNTAMIEGSDLDSGTIADPNRVEGYSNSGIVFSHGGSSDWSNDGNMSTANYNFDFNQAPLLNNTAIREGSYSDSGTIADPNREHGNSNSLSYWNTNINILGSCREKIFPNEGRIFAMARDQWGSSYLQSILERRDTASTLVLFNGTIDHIIELMSHQFGNFLFQKLLEFCKPYQIQQIVCRVTTHERALIDAADDQYGSRSVQKLICITRRSPLLIQLVMAALAPGFVKLMTSRIGKHVIQQCLLRLEYNDNLFLFGEAIKHCLDLATSKEGCLTLNDCINSSRSPVRDSLLKRIAENSLHLSQDPFGNYVLQHVIGLHIPMVNHIICNKLKGNYVRLSKQKCASHVVERCIEYLGVEGVASEILKSDELQKLAKHELGNYIVQRVLKAAKGKNIYRDLMIAIKPFLPSLQCHPYGSNVYYLIRKQE